MHLAIKKALQFLPESPGIYLFYDAKKSLIYVGKATSLRSRVRSYFVKQKGSVRPIEYMIHEVANVKVQKAESVLEAIILEANTIRQLKPKYNVMGRDDKSWNYIVITNDEYPRVETIRQHAYQDYMRSTNIRSTPARHRKPRASSGVAGGKDTKLRKEYAYVFGPYPGLNTKETMKILRRLFGFSTCQRNSRQTSDFGLQSEIRKSQKAEGGSLKSKRPCFYYQMRQCLGVCTGEISPVEYKRRVIGPLVLFLRGKKRAVIRDIEKRMKIAAHGQEFEEAARLRNQLHMLQRIQDVSLLNKSFFDPPSGLRERIRIEGYDISNLGASGIVGSMVVFDSGGPIKSEYRKFRIRTLTEQSDVGALAEMLERRFRHTEWKYPDAVLVDGGLPQVNRAKRVLSQFGLAIPVLGIAKGPLRKKNEFILGLKTKSFIMWVSQNQQLLVRVRDEAHRFAVAYQRKTRKIT